MDHRGSHLAVLECVHTCCNAISEWMDPCCLNGSRVRVCSVRRCQMYCWEIEIPGRLGSTELIADSRQTHRRGEEIATLCPPRGSCCVLCVLAEQNGTQIWCVNAWLLGIVSGTQKFVCGAQVERLEVNERLRPMLISCCWCVVGLSVDGR